MDQQGQLLTLDTRETESCEVPLTKTSIESTIAPAAQDLSAAVKLAAFKLRTQRYMQVIFRMFSM
jgi:hypothetical protein